ncbi:hypothetical protein B0H19DRAFT_958923 [Mycena capillaripes]|nr:hypothetical protein B0H19DRAFT_958923 [Mycena capillaripes]
MKAEENKNLIPRQKLPQSIQLFVSQANFEHAWNTWLGVSLQAKNYDASVFNLRTCSTWLTHDLADMFCAQMAALKPAYCMCFLFATNHLFMQLRKHVSLNRVQEKARCAQRQGYNLDSLGDEKFPEDACVKCWQLPKHQRCRQSIIVEDQENKVNFLRGCGITLALPGERMKPKPPPESRANKPATKIYSPDNLRKRGLKFECIERDEEVIRRCGKQVLHFKNAKGNLIDIAVYEAFPPETMKVLKKHHHAKSKCRPMKRGGQFDFYGDGEMVVNGHSAGSGGLAASGYSAVAGFEAVSLAGIDIIFNEVEDAVLMLEVMKAYHKAAYDDLIEQSEAADRMGNSGINTYKCTCYCLPQHSDKDVCRSMCFQTELKALKGEFVFCQPTYGYYLQTYENMLWTFLGTRLHGTMLPSTTPLSSEDDIPLRLRGAKKNGGRVSNGSHGTATSKNVAKAQTYQAIREKRAARKEFWNS